MQLSGHRRGKFRASVRLSLNPFILFAEDNAELADMIGIACQRAGLSKSEFFICRNGFEAVCFLQSIGTPGNSSPVPTRIVTDLNMPLFNGIDVLSWVKENALFKNIPVTIHTACVDHDLRMRAESLGCSEYLQKTTSFADLLERINSWRGTSGQIVKLENGLHRDNIRDFLKLFHWRVA